MKNKALVVILVVCIVIAIPFIISDAVHKTGAFMSGSTYREYVSEGKGK